MTTYTPLTPRADRPMIVAHRGCSGLVPENTLASFELAIDQGADILELDIHLSADGIPVVVHDATLDRTTDASGPVRERTLDELREVVAGEWQGVPQRIPTLAEVIDLVRARDVGLLVETKFEHAGPELEAAFAQVVRALPDWEAWVPARLMACSFDLDSLLRCRDQIPGVNLAFILVYLASGDGTIVDVAPTTAGLAEPGGSLTTLRERLRAEGIGYLGLAAMGVNGELANDVDEATVSWFREGGVELNFLTDDPDLMRDYVGKGVTNILTNRPDVAAEVLRGTQR